MLTSLKKNVRILIVDDDHIINQLIQTLLERFGYTICGTAADALEAVRLFKQLRPDVVLLDLQMPSPVSGQDERFAGLRAAKQIREIASTPIILLTAHESPEITRRAGEIGVDNYLIKPPRANELDRAIVIALARWEAEEALRQSEERQRQLVEFLPVSIMILDQAGKILFANPAAAQLTGVAKKTDLLGVQLLTMLPLAGRELAYQRLQRVKAGYSLTNLEMDLKLADGTTYYVLVAATPYSYQKQPAILIVMRDITKRKAREAERQALYTRTESLYQVSRTLATFKSQPLPIQLGLITRSVAQALPAARVMLCTVDMRTQQITHISKVGPGIEGISEPSFEQLMSGLSGWAIKHLQPILSLKAKPDPRECLALQQERQDTGGGSVAVTPLLYRSEPLGTLTAINLVDQRDFTRDDLARLTAMGSQIGIALKNALLAQEMADLKIFNESIVRSVGEAILLENDQGEITFANPEATNLFGYSHAELLTHTSSELFADASVIKENNVSPMDNGVTRYETQILNQARVEVPVIISSRPLFQEGESRGVLSAITDITARKEAEEQLQQYAAELEEHNAELDAFAHTVAHDLTGPLSVLMGYTSLLEVEMSSGQIDDAMLQVIATSLERNGQRMANIIEELLLLASIRRKDEIPREPLDVAAIVAAVREQLQEQIVRVAAEVSIPPIWPIAMGYAPWVGEVWVNYLSNALKYGGKPPRVELGAEISSNQMVRFWVRDNGPGLTPEEQEHLFTPFERLNQLRIEGHGLGLSIVQRIISKLGGEVGVESVPGAGSTFYFTLPLAVP
ncbi:MAG TPA: PAS domain S-box protein [Thermoflexia bacterium]|nr:PAS domain S-box protein [Thermoflexia bacterium]